MRLRLNTGLYVKRTWEWIRTPTSCLAGQACLMASVSSMLEESICTPCLGNASDNKACPFQWCLDQDKSSNKSSGMATVGAGTWTPQRLRSSCPPPKVAAGEKEHITAGRAEVLVLRFEDSASSSRFHSSMATIFEWVSELWTTCSTPPHKMEMPAFARKSY